MISELDLIQLNKLGITPEKVEQQIESFITGFPFLNIFEPATVGNGIIRLECDEVDDLVEIFKEYEGTRLKFVPASGAATRMFKHLFEFQQDYLVKGEECMKDVSFNSVAYLIQNIQKLPFYQKLYDELWLDGYKMNELLEKKDYSTILNFLLDSKGLNYGNLPKGLLLFHRYSDVSRTALEEHLVEGAQYCKDPHGNVCLHLTVSPEHLEGFISQVDKVKLYYESHFDVKYHISFSVQKTSTDTIAVDNNNEPFRNSDGSLLFRPGGHGALIENLNEVDAELVFIKNIDNVVPDRLKTHTVRYKKALAGLLLSYRKLIFDYLSKLKVEENLSLETLSEILDFTRNELYIKPPKQVESFDAESLRKYLIKLLDRPIRVCGMVKNQGEPGGGPFWAENPDGSVSLQIVESSQIDLMNPEKKKILSESTHFNPVDLVCSITDHEGRKYDLRRYTDPHTGFISIKSKDGRVLKALELPGLWNGAMSNWNTFFVEVPLITFNPVKTINDLLREEHQP